MISSSIDSNLNAEQFVKKYIEREIRSLSRFWGINFLNLYNADAFLAIPDYFNADDKLCYFRNELTKDIRPSPWTLGLLARQHPLDMVLQYNY